MKTSVWLRKAVKPWWLLIFSLLIGSDPLACVSAVREQRDEPTVTKTVDVRMDQELNSESGTEIRTPILPTIDYEPIPFPRLIGTAELAVTGYVDTVCDTTFVLRIKDVLIGTYNEHTIEIIKIVPTSYNDPRATPYQPNQRFILFLFKDTTDQHTTQWRIYGIGREGEMPVEGDYVYFHGRYVEGLERHTHQVHGVERKIQRYNEEVFKSALCNYGECFVWQADSKEKKLTPKRLCDDRVLEQYRSQSSIHDYLVRETLKQIP